MERDIYKRLEEWKSSDRRKPLVIHGARQVGKTYAMKHFGNAFYKEMVYLNFERDQSLHRYFEGTLDPKRIIQYLCIHTGINIRPEETLLIFDEIQESPKALNSLKYFFEEANEYHLISAGSLLGVKVSGEKGFPVGKVNFLHLYPLTFFEFLSAIGEAHLRLYLESYQSYESLPIPIHENLIEILKFYFFIGGMPEAVANYISTGRLNEIREIHFEILTAYENDFAKHAPTRDIMKIITVWNQIPGQLAKENKKFIFSAIRKSARGREYEDSLQWLSDAGLIYKNHLVQNPKFPLSSYSENNSFKVFLFDVGLLGAMSKLPMQIVIQGDNLFTEFKGALTENFIAQEWIATKQSYLYYWTSEGTAEIDFLIEVENIIYPLEVKAGASAKKKSLLVYNQKYMPSKLIRATTMNLKQNGNIFNYPLYLISRFPIA